MISSRASRLIAVRPKPPICVQRIRQIFDPIGGLLERDVAIVVARSFPRENLPVSES